MEFKNTEVWGFDHALRGMRNPKNSWNKSDSGWFDLYGDVLNGQPPEEYCAVDQDEGGVAFKIIGPNDLKLAQTLINAGPEHRKFLRQIFVSVDITAPLYWYKEFDTYKIGTVANSTSTMHKIASKPITLDCFEIDDLDLSQDLQVVNDYPDADQSLTNYINNTINYLEKLRLKYLETKDMRYWKELIRWLPESWLQTRTWTANYEVLRSMYFQRKGHKLTEWKSFCDWVESLPYAKELILYKS